MSRVALRGIKYYKTYSPHGIPSSYTELSYITWNSGQLPTAIAIPLFKFADVNKIEYTMATTDKTSSNIILGSNVSSTGWIGWGSGSYCSASVNGITNFSISPNLTATEKGDGVIRTYTIIYNNSGISSSYTEATIGGYNPYNFCQANKIYGIKSYLNDIVTHDFIPAKCILDGHVGLYDLTTSSFYDNTGSGSFIAGDDKGKMFTSLIGTNTKIIVPTGYTQLDYIESSGTQYIATGVATTNQAISVTTEMACSRGSNYTKTLGYSTSTSGPPFSLQAINNSYSGYGTQTVSTINITQFNRLDMYNDSVTIPNFYIFDINPTIANYSRTAGKIKTITIMVDRITVRKLIPAKNSLNVVGMYDTVSNNFFTNAGTGDFIAGPISVPSFTALKCIQTVEED